MPKLTSLTTEEDSRSFEFPRSVILEGTSFHSSSSTDIPSLTTVTLEYYYVFANKKTVHTNSSSSSSPSFLDITPALQQYLQFIVSFTHHSHPIAKSPFSFHTAIPPFLPHFHSFYSYRYIARHAIKHSFKPILSFHSNCRDQDIHSLH